MSPTDIAHNTHVPPTKSSNRSEMPPIQTKNKKKGCGFGGCLLAITLIILLTVGGLYFYRIDPYYTYLYNLIYPKTTTISDISISSSIPSTTTSIPLTKNIPATTYAGINPTTGKFGNYYLGLVYVNGGYCSDSYGNPVVLINNSNATNPTYFELLAFLKQDNTDTFPYQLAYANQSFVSSWYGSVENYVNFSIIQSDIQGNLPYPSVPRICADFAERLYNDSELAGIKCGYVVVQLQGVTGGHALDAYQTTDKGLVYVDDTGATPAIVPNIVSPGSITFGVVTTNDKQAYIQQGQELGLIDINSAISFSTDYSGYQSWSSLKAQLDSLEAQYNQLAAGRIIVPQDVYNQLQALLAQEESISNELGGFFDPMGIVTSFSVVWGGVWN